MAITAQYTPGRKVGIGQHGDGTILIAGTEAVADWTVLNADTEGLSVDVVHLVGTKSIEFDKINGDDDSTVGGIYKVIEPGLNLTPLLFTGGLLCWATLTSSNTDLANTFLRLGTSASHYHEWTDTDASCVNDVWSVHKVNILSPPGSQVGNGWNPSAILYVALGFTFDGEDDALADMRVDHIHARPLIDTLAFS